jgi:hypothetical protein
MTKALTTIFTTILISSALDAQIVLDRSDIGVVGTTRDYKIDSTTATVSPGPAGANQSWVFTFSDDGNAQAVFKNPSQTQFAAQFTESNLAMEISGLTFYFDVSDAALKIWGGSGTVANLPPNYLKNNKAVRGLIFPATYGDVVRDTGHFRVRLRASDIDPQLALLNIDSLMWKRRTIRVSEMDGWGRLSINCGNFPDVLRERRIEYHFDTLYTKAIPIPFVNPNPQWQLANIPGIPPTGRDTTHTYAWWGKNLDFSIVEFAVGENDSTDLIRWMPPTDVAPAPQISGASGVCAGQSTVLTATGTFAALQWLRNGVPVAGATQADLTVVEGGTYSVRAVTAEGCTLISPGHLVESFAAPNATITVGGSTVVCEGDSVTLTAPPGMASYSWESGQTTRSIVVTQTGNYAVIVTDSNGCVGNSEPVSVTFVQPGPAPVINVSGDGISQLCFTSATPVAWEIFNDANVSVKTGSGTEICLTPAEALSGKVVARRDCGPESEKPFAFTVARTENAFDFSLYPNPAAGAVHVGLKDGGPCTATVFDPLGRPVFRTTFTRQAELPSSDWPAGIYCVVLRNEIGSAFKSLIISR